MILCAVAYFYRSFADSVRFGSSGRMGGGDGEIAESKRNNFIHAVVRKINHPPTFRYS